MWNRSTRLLALTTLLTLAFSSNLLAAQPRYTTILVKDMHCATCAKKIAARLYVLPGVVEVRADVEANTAYVIPQQQKELSPRGLWNAVEEAGFQPLKLSGPGGTFTSKPKT